MSTLEMLAKDEVLEALDEAEISGVIEFVAAGLQIEDELRGAGALGVGAVDGAGSGDAIVNPSVVGAAVHQHRVLALVRALDARRQWPLRCRMRRCSSVSFAFVACVSANDLDFMNGHSKAVFDILLAEHVDRQLMIVSLWRNT